MTHWAEDMGFKVWLLMVIKRQPQQEHLVSIEGLLLMSFESAQDFPSRTIQGFVLSLQFKGGENALYLKQNAIGHSTIWKCLAPWALPLSTHSRHSPLQSTEDIWPFWPLRLNTQQSLDGKYLHNLQLAVSWALFIKRCLLMLCPCALAGWLQNRPAQHPDRYL